MSKGNEDVIGRDEKGWRKIDNISVRRESIKGAERKIGRNRDRDREREEKAKKKKKE